MTYQAEIFAGFSHSISAVAKWFRMCPTHGPQSLLDTVLLREELCLFLQECCFVNVLESDRSSV